MMQSATFFPIPLNRISSRRASVSLSQRRRSKIPPSALTVLAAEIMYGARNPARIGLRSFSVRRATVSADGNVYVDGELLDEPYLTEKALGDCDIALPYQVPDNRYFCMGDHRSTSVDSRSTTVGCVSDEQIVGKIVFRAWPLLDFGTLR